MKNPKLTTENGINEALANMIMYRTRCSTEDILDAVEDSRTGEELVKRLNHLPLFERWVVDRETETRVRLKATDCFGNTKYFKAEK